VSRLSKRYSQPRSIHSHLRMCAAFCTWILCAAFCTWILTARSSLALTRTRIKC
jgi:hypothetical protein